MNDVVRKLASVRRIQAIDAIPDADNIVCATVDGWKLVTQKSNNFQVGDLVVYFEIDSFLPITEMFEFLRKSSYRKMGEEEGFRLKTIKLRGQISQGLILPLDEIFTHDGRFFKAMDHGGDSCWMKYDGDSWVSAEVVGFDLTELLKVKKWEPPIPAQLAGKVRGNYPSFITKTDQERIQNLFKYRDDFLGQEYEVTLKLDGSSMTVYFNNDHVGVCSRNLELEETEDNAFWKVARSTNIIDALKAYGNNIAIQGELMGPGVQNNREGLKELRMYIFDVFNIDTHEYLNYSDRMQIIDILTEFGCKADIAPIIGFKTIDAFDTVEKFLDYADSIPSITHPIAEGVVYKNTMGKRHSFKVISNKFLLKEKD